eukprot:Tamp_31311.p1 GENE.Tamp_31311~~Tamp_31311.p1  ORF type:complete len:151 (-),score=38.38 Tamp_31311:250-702(-)
MLRRAATPVQQQKRYFLSAFYDIFVQAKGLSPSQGQENATTYRTVAPGTLAQQQKPVVPQGEEGREYTIAYYKRDTRRGVDWNYQDAEGKLAPTTPFKYMDGTPFLKQYKLKEDLPSQCPKVEQGAPSHVAGLPPTAGRIPQYQPSSYKE